MISYYEKPSLTGHLIEACIPTHRFLTDSNSNSNSKSEFIHVHHLQEYVNNSDEMDVKAISDFSIFMAMGNIDAAVKVCYVILFIFYKNRQSNSFKDLLFGKA